MATSFSMLSTETIKMKFKKAVFSNKLQKLKDLVKVLVDERGLTVKDLSEIYDDFGRNVLFPASMGCYIDICKYLVEELKFDVNEENDKGDTPLIFAGNCITAAYLLDQGADLNAVNEQGYTILHYCAIRGQTDMVRLLISRGAKVDIQASLMGTPLQAAATDGMSESVKVLLENHSDPNAAAVNTVLPLFSAIKVKSVDCARHLLEWGADLNISWRELTPLIFAVQEKQMEIIKLLLMKGANPNIQNFLGLAPIEIAAMTGYRDGVVALFPVSKPIANISDWSVRGILKYVKSAKANNEGKFNTERRFSLIKEKANELTKTEQYRDATLLYTDALGLKPKDAVIYSNRSFCWARLGLGDLALRDAMDCIKLKTNWPKAHYRAGAAYTLLRDYRKAKEEYGIALKLAPNCKDIQDAYREASLDLQALQMYELENYGFSEGLSLDDQEEAYQEYISSLL